MAIDVGESNFPQPLQLAFDIEQLVGRILGLDCSADAMQKFFMQTR